MARLISSIDDSTWTEVRFINGYAVFIGYLMMGIRGLGVSIITWTTVVLLGGFVSVLGKKDFWCLTGITLVQTAGVFNFLLTDKLTDFVRLSWGLLGAALTTVSRPFRMDMSWSRVVLALYLSALQLLVMAVILCPVAVLYVFGLYISAGVSLWRLIEHDSGNADGGANLKPALQVLYGLAAAQGVLFAYKNIHTLAATIGLAEHAARVCLMDKELISGYLDETVAGCEKDPSFATGRNIITYAVGLMESRISSSYFIGVQILGTILQHQDENMRYSGQLVLMKQLLTGSASVQQRLLDTLGTRSPCSPEIREHAARIVAHVAGSISLAEQLPGGTMIRCLSSLLDTTLEEYSWRPEGYVPDSGMPKEYERDWLLEEFERDHLIKFNSRRSRPSSSDRKSPEHYCNTTLLRGYRRQVVTGIRILQKLAMDEDNCKVISNTQGLLSKIATMAPLTSSEQLHGDHHDEWSRIAEESMKLLSRLMAAPGDAGSKLRSEISGSGRAATITNNILECTKCGVILKRQAVQIILDLPVDAPPSIVKSSGSNNRIIFMGLLLHIFLLPDSHFLYVCGSIRWAKKSCDNIRKLAGEKLQSLLCLQDEAGGTSMLPASSVAAVVSELTRTSVDAAKNITYRLHAVQILEDLCRYHTKGDRYLKELKNAVADIMPQILKEILCFGSSSAGMHAKAEANNDQQVSAQHTDDDIEKGVVPLLRQVDVQEDASCSQQQSGDEQQEGFRLQEAFISLCRAIDFCWGHQFDYLAMKTCLEKGISKPVTSKPVLSLHSFSWLAKDLLEKQKGSKIGH